MTLKLLPSEMKLTDTIKLFDGPWGYGIVSQIKDGLVHVFRPYGATTDFSMSDTVITYHGTENMTLDIDSTYKYEVPERKNLR